MAKTPKPPKPPKVDPISLSKDGTLTLGAEGDYSVETLSKGKVNVVYDNGSKTKTEKFDWADVKIINLSDSSAHLDIDYSQLGSRTTNGDGYMNITGVTFTGADAATNNKFEPDQNLNTILDDYLNDHPISFIMSHLTVNGSQTDAFKTMWDLLDDRYNVEGYYNATTNEQFVYLGLDYVKYLEAGGQPLVDVTAKYAPDSNGNGIPQRAQSMHDNLLGNLDRFSLQDKFGSDPATLSKLLALIPDEYETRGSDGTSNGVFDGNEGSLGGTVHDHVRAFDWDHGWNRNDYIDRSFGKVDPLASDDRDNSGTDEQMHYGTANSNDHFSIVRHEGAGVELALKAKEYGPNGGDYSAGHVQMIGGVAHYTVSAGASPDNANRADWSFDYAATVLPQGTDDAFTFKLKIDTDATEGVNLVEIPTGTAGGMVQDSSNYAFYRALIDSDPNTDGVQPYSFGEGEFDITLEAYHGGTLIASNKIVVHVSQDVII